MGARAARAHAFRWGAALRTWLAGILVNCHREAVRARASSRTVEVDVHSIPARAGAPQVAHEIEKAVARLPDGYREVFVLYHDGPRAAAARCPGTALSSHGCVVVTGLPLDSTGYMLVPDDDSPALETRFPQTIDGRVDGLFVIRGRAYEEALRMARTTPHLRYRDRISVRRITPL